MVNQKVNEILRFTFKNEHCLLTDYVPVFFATLQESENMPFINLHYVVFFRRC